MYVCKLHLFKHINKERMHVSMEKVSKNALVRIEIFHTLVRQVQENFENFQVQH